MVKRKTRSHKKGRSLIHRIPLSEQDASTEKILIENFVALQRVMTHLSEKFDSLSSHISKLLNLFELSAKALAEKEFNTEKGNKDVEKLTEKLDGLLEQNKTIAKGLVLLHEGISPTRFAEPRIQESRIPEKQEAPVFIPTPSPFTIPNSSPPSNTSTEKYQKSISSEEDSSQKPQLFKFKPLPKEGNV